MEIKIDTLFFISKTAGGYNRRILAAEIKKVIPPAEGITSRVCNK